VHAGTVAAPTSPHFAPCHQLRQIQTLFVARMGNSAYTGHMMNACGCTEALGFEQSARGLITMHGIEPWNARELIRENLKRQAELAKRSPLRFIHVRDGLQYIGEKAHAWFSRTLTRDRFARAASDLLYSRNIQHTAQDRDQLLDVFDSMDFDRNGSLSLGEWAGGLSVFFKGTQDESVHAVFMALDTDKSGTLTSRELQEYLKPFVKAMSPATADSLRPLLLKKATMDLYDEMDLDHKNDISVEELLGWSRRGNNIIDKLADIIDKEVYRIWLREKERRAHQNYAAGYRNGPNNYGGSTGYYGTGNESQGGNMMGTDPYGNQSQSPYNDQSYNNQQYNSQDPYGASQSHDKGFSLFGSSSPKEDLYNKGPGQGGQSPYNGQGGYNDTAYPNQSQSRGRSFPEQGGYNDAYGQGGADRGYPTGQSGYGDRGYPNQQSGFGDRSYPEQQTGYGDRGYDRGYPSGQGAQADRGFQFGGAHDLPGPPPPPPFRGGQQQQQRPGGCDGGYGGPPPAAGGYPSPAFDGFGGSCQGSYGALGGAGGYSPQPQQAAYGAAPQQQGYGGAVQAGYPGAATLGGYGAQPNAGQPAPYTTSSQTYARPQTIFPGQQQNARQAVAQTGYSARAQPGPLGTLGYGFR